MTALGEPTDWSELERAVGSRLIDGGSPLQTCIDDPGSAACSGEIARLSNPFAIEDDPGAYHTTGWLDAFEARHSPKVVVAESVHDIAAALRFCADRGLQVVAKGTGHDYLGRSSDPRALMVWTHHLRDIIVHDAFAPEGGDPGDPGVPAVSVGAGTCWLDAYQALQPHGRYVQGGGCTSVGVVGFTLGGGFGSFSRRFGTAAGNLLEAEVVTASGNVVVANIHRHPELFWALRGGGFGLGIVTRLTFRTHQPPPTLGAVAGTVRARSAAGYRRLIRRLVDVSSSLCDEHWGEQIRFLEDNSVELALTATVSEQEANAVWEPFFSWVASQPDDYHSDALVVVVPFEAFWDPRTYDVLAPAMIRRDDRPGQPGNHFWWSPNQVEVSQYLHSYQSRWLPGRLLTEAPEELADSLFEATRHWRVSLHLNKALFGAAREAVERDSTTAINPAVFEAAALVIAASSQQYVFPGVPGHEPDLELARERARRVTAAMTPIRAIAAGAGSYVNETDYFEKDWQDAFWGANYVRLLDIKRRYDPNDLFRTHHGVGSEG
jgi:FAD/FMN-containing dehydrogenase